MKKVCGVGVRDVENVLAESNKRAYHRWRCILRRCYVKTEKIYKFYGGKGVYVCQEWLRFSNFLSWYLENYIEGFEIDKDISGVVDEKGNKYYSPESCRFVAKLSNIDARAKGENHYSTHPLVWYEHNQVRRDGFKRTCDRVGWNFSDFEEFWVGSKLHRGKKTFLYFHKESTTPRPIRMTDREFPYIYQTTPIKAYAFLKHCERHSYNVSDFVKIDSGLKSGNNKRFYFILKSRVIPY